MLTPETGRRETDAVRRRGLVSPLVEARLTDAELDAYRTEGLVIPRYRVSQERLQAMRETLERLIAENPRVRPEHPVLRWGSGPALLPTHAAFLDYERLEAEAKRDETAA